MDITSSYIPQPFEMTSGKWHIISPPPSMETGKLLAAYLEIQAAAFNQAKHGQTLDLESLQAKFTLTDEEAMNLVLGSDQVHALTVQGCPAALIMHATMCAIYYWAFGGSEEAVQMYLAAADAVNGEDDPKDELRSRIRSLIGHNTDSVSQSDIPKTAHQSTQNTQRRKSKKKRRR